MTRPKMKHAKVQLGLVRLLQPFALDLGIVAIEVAFRALPEFPEYDLRGADVAFVSQARWDNTPDDDNLKGSPELVIEVPSPSNTRAEMREKAALCLSTGAEEFWVVDTKQNTVRVTRRSSEETLYRPGDRIPLTVFGGGARLETTPIFRS